MRLNRFITVAALALAAGPALAADVNVRITVGDPGYYGRLDVNGYPQPQVVYAEPRVIQPAPVAAVRDPVYVRVPTSQAQDWRTYCRRYDACGQPVYFVQDSWYSSVYAPQYRDKHGAEKQAKDQLKQQKKTEKQQAKIAKEQAKIDKKKAKLDHKLDKKDK